VLFAWTYRTVELSGDAPSYAQPGGRITAEQPFKLNYQIRQEVILDPIAHELVSRGELEYAACKPVKLDAGKPLSEGSRRTSPGLLECLLPGHNAALRILHRNR